LYKEPIDDIPFKYCNDTEIGYTISGENADFPCFGYVLDTFANQSDVATF
jgi:hypothetical protein